MADKKVTVNPKGKIDWRGLLLKVLLPLVIGIATGAGVTIGIKANEGGGVDVEVTTPAASIIELSPEQVPAVIETSEGEIEVVEMPTVESVDGNQLIDECPEDEPECGQGRYVYAPTDTMDEFINYTNGGCWDIDSAYGSQCWDLAALFWMNATSDARVLSTCGTGAAKGAWNCKEQNAGDEFELIYNATDVKAGDWIIFGSGQYGHVGMARGAYNNGYVSLFGQNQGGSACPGGGSSANTINISLKSFVGAFRPKKYIKPEPQPEPQPEPIPISGCVEWGVKRGDTMSRIMLDCEGTVVYGEAMDNYAKSWYSRIYKPGQSVYDGWHSSTGVGLYAGDWIDHKTK